MIIRKEAPKRMRSHSIFASVIIAMLVMAVVNMALVFALMSWGGVIGSLNQNALDLLAEHTENKQLPVQQEMIDHQSLLASFSSAISNLLEDELQAMGATTADLRADASVGARLAQAAAPDLILCMRSVGATGAFLVLDGVGVAGQDNTYAGVYFRDTDPNTVTPDNSDVLVERGLPPLARSMGLSLDSFWSATFAFDEGEGEFFFRPLNAARNGANPNAAFCGCWCGPMNLNSRDTTSVITYSVPVLSSSGEVMGVIGTEITLDYLQSMIGAGEFLRSQTGSYALARRVSPGVYETVISLGSVFHQYFGHDASVRLTSKEGANGAFVRFHSDLMDADLDGAVFPLHLYNGNSPFQSDEWDIIGLQPQAVTYGATTNFMKALTIATVSALVCAVIISLLIAVMLTRKIGVLVEQLRSHNDEEQLTLSHTGLIEVDTLADEVMRQNRRALGQARRMESVLSMTGTAVGVYELPRDSVQAYCSRGLYRLFGMSEDQPTTIPMQTFLDLLGEKLIEEVEPDIWRVQNLQGVCYLRHKRVNTSGSVIGTLLDVTSELENRYRLEHERDHDALTGLINRRAFARITRKLFDVTPELLKTTVFVMMDLDSLKFVNDTYGHDWGDSYIRSFADALSDAFGGERCVCGRRSGDEFFVLMYGWEDRAMLKKELDKRLQQLTSKVITLPGNRAYPVQASGGIAWYPDDGQSLEAVLRYADFAMYKAKRDRKGMIVEFDREVYSQDAILVSGRDALRRMLRHNLVKYVFQPIVSAKDGSVYAYELLLRPQVAELATPAAALRVAKEHGMLHHMERMTWYTALDTARKMREKGLMSPQTKLFVNSLTNQLMDAEEERELLESFADLMPNVVMELTESENNVTEYTDHKIRMIRSVGGQVAIDDFGSGYNSELVLIQIDSDYVKLDMSFVRNVDVDRNKQAMIRALIGYAHTHGIVVICEGVETPSELRTLASFGVEHFQGYFLGRPEETPTQPSEESVALIRSLNAQ